MWLGSAVLPGFSEGSRIKFFVSNYCIPIPNFFHFGLENGFISGTNILCPLQAILPLLAVLNVLVRSNAFRDHLFRFLGPCRSISLVLSIWCCSPPYFDRVASLLLWIFSKAAGDASVCMFIQHSVYSVERSRISPLS
jgi:hypothetical protein